MHTAKYAMTSPQRTPISAAHAIPARFSLRIAAAVTFTIG